MYTKIIKALGTSEKIAIFAHTNPDGDAIGSMLAMYTFLKKKEKIVRAVPSNTTTSLPPKLSFLPHFDKIGTESPEVYDCCIAVDCGDASRLSDENFKVFIKAKTRIVIDHHESHESFAPLTLCETSAASTTQIIYKLLEEYDIATIDDDIAMQLYVGMVTDSGSFSYSNTSVETHAVASKLLGYNIDAGYVSRKVMKDTPFNNFNLKNKVLSKAKFFEDNQIAVISFNNEDFESTSTTESDTEGIINNILDIETVKVAISIAEIKDKAYKVSFRTKEKVNAASIARVFGGGGHSRAAGCRVYGYYEDVYNKLLSATTEMLKYA